MSTTLPSDDAALDDSSNDNDNNSRLAIGSTSKSLTWYQPTLASLTTRQRDLFENYSHIPPKDVIPHILTIRDRAWHQNPLPCIGMFRFLDLHLPLTPSFPTLLHTLRSSSSASTSTSTPGGILDLGCCFGQELRFLARAGVPRTALYGLELRPAFIALGYDLFLDRATLGARFFTGDVLADDDDARPGASWTTELAGRLDVVLVKQFLHLFDWAEQRRICERIVGLLRPRPGVLVLGHQMGRLVEGEVPWGRGKMVFRHSRESWGRLWEEVGERTGSRWRVRMAEMDDALGERPWDDELTQRLVFEVERVA